jgi:hypothetical protein
MTVKELIEELEKMPQEARVFHLWDGEPRTAINIVYESKNGRVITSDYSMVCYSDEARPKGAPTVSQDEYWHTDLEPSNYNQEEDEFLKFEEED